MKRSLYVLIASDDAGLRRSLAELIAADGHRPEFPFEGKTLFASLRESAPDLLLLDLAGADEQGIDVLHRLVRHRLVPRTPVIVLADRAELEYELLDAFDFLPRLPDSGRLRADLDLLARASPGTEFPSALSAAEARPFQEYLVQHTGLHFDQRNLRQLERGLLRRLRAVQAPDFSAYFGYLKRNAEERGELKKLLSLLTVGETYFFRYRSDRDALVQDVLPELLRRRGGERKLRIWSAGCSTGEEPYSLSILLLEHFSQLADWKIDLFATDINKRALRHARQGLYNSHALRLTAGEYREKYFRTLGNDLFLLEDRVRQLVRFAYLNLQAEDYSAVSRGTGDLDLVFCRNVLIYFGRETQRQVIERIHRCLRPGGYLFLGHAETLAGMGDLFERIHQHGTFFYQKADAKPKTLSPYPAPMLPLRAKGPVPAGEMAAPAGSPPPPEREHLLNKAILSFNREDFVQAAELLGEILRHFPGDVQALVRQGLVLANRGRYAEAREFCAQAIGIDDLCPDAYLLRGLIFEMEGDAEAAAAEYRKVIWLSMDFIIPRYYLARIYARQSRHREADREMRTTLRLLEKLPAEAVIPYSGGLSREVFLELCRDDLAGLSHQEAP